MTFTELIPVITDFFVHFQWTYGVELLLFFLLIFSTMKVLQDNDAMKLNVIYVLSILVIGGLCLFTGSNEFTSRWFLIAVVCLSAFFLLLFSMEIKHSIWNGKANKKRSSASSGSEGGVVYSKEETEECISSIISALQNMSKNDIGALIVLSNGNLPKQIIESGTPLGAEISRELIEGVFFPKAPLHDGALIIEDHKISAAGCFLPLTQNNEKYPKDLGTRHRAGIGITEVANVTSLIVSEETGIISIVKQGKVTRYADYNMIETVLREYYWKELAPTAKRK